MNFIKLYFLSFWILTFSQNLIFANVRTLRVSPLQTDTRILTFVSDSHQIYFDPQSTKRNQLMVYLPAAYDAASSASQYCSLAANAGYHVISLTYPSTNKLYSTCDHSTDANCYENFHREIVEGKNYSSWIVVDSTESIFFRLSALLLYLQLKYPDENWSSYLNNFQGIKQASVVWSGHSDAAGHVAVISKYFEIHKAICFSGPKDFSLHYYLPPIWLHTGAWNTDKKNIYVFGHLFDEYLFQKEIWDSLGLSKYGAPVNVDQVAYPYRNSHILVTSQNVAVGDRHGCTVQDNRTPMDKSDPVFMKIWNYLLDIVLNVTSIKDSKPIRYSVYPNPIQRGAQLTVKDLEQHRFEKIDLVSVDGKQIISFAYSDKIKIPLVPPGIYMLKMKNKTQTECQKLMIIE